MRLTTKGRYAVRSAICLARRSTEGAPVSIRDIAEEEKISADFLEQIFYRLRKNGIVSSARGPGGGFYFSRPLQSITLLDILDAADEGLDFSPCLQEDSEACGREDTCSARPIWIEFQSMMRDFARSRSLADLVSQKGRLGAGDAGGGLQGDAVHELPEEPASTASTGNVVYSEST